MKCWAMLQLTVSTIWIVCPGVVQCDTYTTIHGCTFLHSIVHSSKSSHTVFQAPYSQLPLMSLNELFIHKFILKQFLECHDTCHDFVFSVSESITRVPVTQHPSLLPYSRPCSSSHLVSLSIQHRAGNKVCSRWTYPMLKATRVSWRQVKSIKHSCVFSLMNPSP